MEKNKNIKICRNGLTSLGSREFKVDKELKEEFLSDKHPNTAKQIRVTLFKAENSEIDLGKSLYDFTLEDIENMIFTNFAYKSEKALSSKVSHMRKYVEFCIKKNYAKVNNFKLVYKLEKYKNEVAEKNKYITFDKLMEYENILLNPTDKLLLELLFLGLTQEEICSLKKSDISFRRKTITITDSQNNKKIIENIPDRLIKIASDNETTEKYYSNNNDSIPVSGKYVNEIKPHAFKVPDSPYVFSPLAIGTVKNTLSDEKKYIEPSIAYIQGKMIRFRTWLKNPYITTKSIRMSGIADYTLRYIDKKGGEDKMSINDYSQIYKKFYKGDSQNIISVKAFKSNIKEIIALLKEQ